MNQAKNKIRLLLVDDHTLFLQGTSSILSDHKQLRIVGQAHNGQEALHMLSKQQIDIVLTDISMPVVSGLDLIKNAKKDYPKVKIIVISMHDELKFITSAMNKGVDGYLLKNAAQEELFQAITVVNNDEQYISEEVKNAVLQQMITSKQKKPFSGLPELSDREKEVLNLIATEHTQEEIAKKLFISVNTVVFHRRKLLHKFNVKNTAGLVKKAMQMDLIS